MKNKIDELSIQELNEYEKACMEYLKYFENQDDEYKKEHFKDYSMIGTIMNNIFSKIKEKLLELHVKD